MYTNHNAFTFWIIACLAFAAIPAAMAVTETTSPSLTTGTIQVNSDPAGAAVSLNGVYFGDTPATFDTLPPGDYVVEVALAGYETERIPVVLWGGSLREIVVQLQQVSGVSTPRPTFTQPGGYGSIAIDSNPGGGTVMLDGSPAGQTPAGRAALILNTIPAGNHTIVVELAGYPPYTRTVSVVKNQVVQVTAEFLPRSPTVPGTMVITTDRREPIPLSPLAAIAAIALIGLAAISRRS